MRLTQQENKPLSLQECAVFDTCSASYCPIVRAGSWYSEEAVCTNVWFQEEHEVEVQKKLKKHNCEGLFTPEILKNIRRISSKTKGITVL